MARVHAACTYKQNLTQDSMQPPSFSNVPRRRSAYNGARRAVTWSKAHGLTLDPLVGTGLRVRGTVISREGLVNMGLRYVGTGLTGAVLGTSALAGGLLGGALGLLAGAALGRGAAWYQPASVAGAAASCMLVGGASLIIVIGVQAAIASTGRLLGLISLLPAAALGATLGCLVPVSDSQTDNSPPADATLGMSSSEAAAFETSMMDVLKRQMASAPAFNGRGTVLAYLNMDDTCSNRAALARHSADVLQILRRGGQGRLQAFDAIFGLPTGDRACDLLRALARQQRVRIGYGTAQYWKHAVQSIVRDVQPVVRDVPVAPRRAPMDADARTALVEESLRRWEADPTESKRVFDRLMFENEAMYETLSTSLNAGATASDRDPRAEARVRAKLLGADTPFQALPAVLGSFAHSQEEQWLCLEQCCDAPRDDPAPPKTIWALLARHNEALRRVLRYRADFDARAETSSSY